jgi:hypothetical protein
MPAIEANTDQFDDRTILALTARGEFDENGVPGWTTILNVIVNRSLTGQRRWNADLRHLCLQYEQFDCWFPGPDCNRIMAIPSNDPDLQVALGLADQALAGTLVDLTDGATSYYDTSISPPYWAVGKTPCFIMDKIRFYKGV